MPSYSYLLRVHRADSAQEHTAASTRHLRKKLKSGKMKAFDLAKMTGKQIEIALHCKRRKARRRNLSGTVVMGTVGIVIAGRGVAPAVVMAVPVVGHCGMLVVVRLSIGG